MNDERRDNACERHREELLRCSYDAGVEPSPDLRAHLDACEPCRVLLDETRSLVQLFSTALRPEPLPSSARQRIVSRLDAEFRTGRHRWVLPLRILGTAAAACLLVAVLVPWRGGVGDTKPGTETGEPVALSENDTAVIAAAWMLSSWDDAAIEYSVDALSEKVADVSQMLEREEGSGSLLPWGADDDWDLPTVDMETSGARDIRGFCAVSADRLAHLAKPARA